MARETTGLDIYLQSLGWPECTPLTPEEEISASPQRLAEANRKLVVHVAKKFQGYASRRGLEMDDLVAAGNEALVRAANGFDPELGNRFSTYAGVCIRNEILSAVKKNRQPSRVPLDLPVRIDDELGLSLLEEVIPGPGLDPAQIFEAKELREELDHAIKVLNPRRQKALDLHYGLTDRQPRTLKEVGEKLGITDKAVSLRKQAALRKLRHPKLSKPLRPFLDF